MELEEIGETVGEKKWIVIGDFNEVMVANEWNGQGNYMDTRLMDFKEVIGKSQLMAIQYMGGPYTWKNGGRGGRLCQRKINWTFINEQWRWMWLMQKSEIYAGGSNDHYNQIT